MNRLKSIFISLATMYWIAVFIGALIEGFSGNEWYFGLLLSTVIPALFLARLFIFKTPRTLRNPLLVLLFILIGFSVEVFYFMENDEAPDVMLLAGFSFVLWLAYIYWYSVFPDRDSEWLPIKQMRNQLKTSHQGLHRFP